MTTVKDDPIPPGRYWLSILTAEQYSAFTDWLVKAIREFAKKS